MTNYKMPRSIALDISECVSRALHEDIGDGDITALLVPLKKSATAKIIASYFLLSLFIIKKFLNSSIFHQLLLKWLPLNSKKVPILRT